MYAHAHRRQHFAEALEATKILNGADATEKPTLAVVAFDDAFGAQRLQRLPHGHAARYKLMDEIVFRWKLVAPFEVERQDAIHQPVPDANVLRGCRANGDGSRGWSWVGFG